MGREINENRIKWLKLFTVLFLWSVYYFGIHLLSRIIYRDYYYVVPTVSRFLSMIGCFVICIIVMVFNKEFLQHIIKRNRFVCVLMVFCAMILLSPFVFINCATVADEYSIIKTNIYGATTKEFKYDDIAYLDYYGIPYRKGLQYEITFKDGSYFVLFTHEALINNFGDKENISKFNKAITESQNTR